MPDAPMEWLKHVNVALEVFAGKAVWSSSCSSRGWIVLPPIEIVVAGHVKAPADITDPKIWQKVLRWLEVVDFVHFGTPCSSFSQARKDDGGPPPLRTADDIFGLSGLTEDDQKKVLIGNQLAEVTIEIIRHLSPAQLWSIENPAGSFLWQLPDFMKLAKQQGVLRVDFHMCAFGHKSMKPTAILTNCKTLQALGRTCPGCLFHLKLKGQVWDPETQQMQWRTKLAQVYPEVLCQEWAELAMIQRARDVGFGYMARSFMLTTPAAERKRPVGTPSRYKAPATDWSANAVKAGYQTKKGRVEPLLPVELEPGQATWVAVALIHPFTKHAKLDYHEERIYEALERDVKDVKAQRQERNNFWGKQAEALRGQTATELNNIKDVYIRRLLCGGRDKLKGHEELGTFFHIALWRAMAAECQSVDAKYLDELMEGLPIVGLISASNRWPSHPHQPRCSMQSFQTRAWATRTRLERRMKTRGTNKNSKVMWDNTLQDVEDGFTLGPFFDPKEIDKLVGSATWVPTERIDVEQKNKVRECDSATVSLSNQMAAVTEKLQLPSTDKNVGVIKRMLKMKRSKVLKGWVLDEKKAYRQIPVKPSHRRFSVVAMVDPGSKKLAYFVMISHSFGLTAAVYNYNRRSALLNEFMVKIFLIAAHSYYDDKFGFEPAESVLHAHSIVQDLHKMLGARFDEAKCQRGSEVEILGVTYDLDELYLRIKEKRKDDIVAWIDEIRKRGRLDPGEAGKLKGVLQFAASQIWGKVGRAFLRVLSERQYDKRPNPDTSINEALDAALIMWRYLVASGPPRPIAEFQEATSDVVIFTDGFWPDENDTEPPRIGGTIIVKEKGDVFYFTLAVPKEIMEEWIPRATQIMMIEMLAPVVTIYNFQNFLRDKLVLLFVDSEAVEGALVKGYSSKEDLSWLTAVFWEQALKLKASIYIDRVATDANPGDGPSRDRVREALECRWQEWSVQFPDVVLKGLGEFLRMILDLPGTKVGEALTSGRSTVS